MAAFEFEFNQTDLAKVINDPTAANDLLIAIFSHKDDKNPTSELYLAAQSCDTNGIPNQNIAPEVACPVPPGWRPANVPPNITHAQLTNCPKFSVPSNIKNRLLNNKFPIAGNELLTVSLEATIVSNPISILVIKASCKIKDINGGIIDTVNGDVK